MSIILKVLSGPHTGAEISLDDGEYILGKDDNCDIIISDGSVSDQHLKITINGPAISGEILDGKVYIDGNKAEGSTIAISQFKVITVGIIHLCFGDDAQAWPEIILPDISKASAPSVQESPSQDADDSENNDTAQNTENNDGGDKQAQKQDSSTAEIQTDNEGTPEDEENQDAVGENEKSEKKKAKPMSITVKAGIAVAALIIVVFALVKIFSPSEQEKRISKLSSIVAEKGLWTEFINAEQTPSNGALGIYTKGKKDAGLKGIVDSDIKLKELNEALSALGFTVENNVASLSGVAERVQGVLDKNEWNISVSPYAGYRMRITGFVKDEGVESSIREALAKVIPEGIDVKYYFVNWDKVKPELFSIATQNGLGRLLFRPLTTGIEVAGTLSGDEYSMWRKVKMLSNSTFQIDIPFSWYDVKKEIEKKKKIKDKELKKPDTASKVTVTVVNNSKGTKKSEKVVTNTVKKQLKYIRPSVNSITIEEVNMGEPSWFIDNTGKRVLQGEITIGGYVLRDVFADGVVLIRDNDMVILNVGAIFYPHKPNGS
jgi:type III secretion system YscD/HrpQ family protein